jgi:ribose transport system ATP-binding protein
MNEPTRGIDVGAKVEVYKLMESFRENGLGIIMISSELLEIMAIADRIVTIHDGKVSDYFEKKDFDQENILKSALGKKE